MEMRTQRLLAILCVSLVVLSAGSAGMTLGENSRHTPIQSVAASHEQNQGVKGEAGNTTTVSPGPANNATADSTDGSVSVEKQMVSTTETSSSEVRPKAEEAVTDELDSGYQTLYEKGLNAEWYEQQAETKADTVARGVSGDLSLPAKGLKKAMVFIGGKSAPYAKAAYTYTRVIARIGILVSSIDAAQVGSTMDSPESYETVRDKMPELRQNAEDIEQASTTAEKKEEFKQRKQLIEDLYTLLPTYLDSARDNVLENPVYDLNLISFGGASWNLGRSAYSTIRWNTEVLRHNLLIDYRVTTMWINDDSTGESLVAQTEEQMPDHQLDYSTQWSRVYDTMDTGDDYAVYKIDVSEEVAGSEKNLRARIGTSDHENFTAYFSESKPTSIENPPGTEFIQTRTDIRHTEKGIDAGTYYVTVKTTNGTALYYKFETSVFKPDWLPLIDLEHQAPPVTVVDVGAGGEGDTGSGSQSIPQEPKPKITSIQTTPSESQIEPGDSIVVNITASSRGQAADWQTVALASPVLAPQNITVLNQSSEFDRYLLEREPGESAGWRYGTNQTEVRYPLVEGAASDWSYDETRHLTARIELPEDVTEPLPLYVKSVARGDDGFTADPPIGQTAVTDQQAEYVQVDRIGDSWPMVGRNPQRAAYNPFETRNSTDVTVVEMWRKGGVRTGAIYDGKSIYYGDNGGITEADSITGEVVNTYRNDDRDRASTLPSISFGRLYYINYNKRIGNDDEIQMIINGLDVSSSISRVIGGPRDKHSSPVTANGIIYFSHNDRMQAYDIDTGKRIWDNRLTGRIRSDQAISNGSVYISDETGTVYSLNSVTGKEAWNRSIGERSESTPTLGQERVYVGSNTGLHALDPADGSLLWNYSTVTPVQSSVAIANGSVYFGANDGYFYALNASTGAVEWKFFTGNKITEQAAIADDIVYFGSDNHYAYALDTNSGDVIWRYLADGSIASPITVADNHLYFRTDQNTLYALKEVPENGTGDVTIKTNTAGGPPSRNKSIEVWLTNASDVAGYQATLSFDPSVMSVENVSGGAFGNPEYRIDNSEGYVQITQAQSATIDVSTPTVAELTVNATGDVGARTDLQFDREGTKVSDELGREVTPQIRQGSFTVYPLGDVDHDGEVATGDAVLTKRKIADLPIDRPFDPVAADLTGDGTIDVRDAVLLQQKIVGADSSTTESVTTSGLGDQSETTPTESESTPNIPRGIISTQNSSDRQEVRNQVSNLQKSDGYDLVNPQSQTSVQEGRIGNAWPMIGRNSQQTGYNPFEVRESTDLSVRKAWNYTGTESGLAVYEGKVYFGTSGGYSVVDAKTGLKSSFGNTVDLDTVSTPAVAYDSVFISGFDNRDRRPNDDPSYKLVSRGNVNSGGGYHLSYSSDVSIPVVSKGSVYLSTLEGTEVAAYDADTGNKVMTATTNATIRTPPAVYNGSLYVTDTSGRIYAFNAVIGTELWNVSVGNYSSSTPTGQNGRIYVGGSDGLYALDEETGEQLWKHPTMSYVNSSVAVANGSVYFGADDGYFYALNATTGAVQWKFLTGTRGTAQPAVIDGIVYFGSDDHFVYALNTSNGEIIWRYQADGSVSRVAVADHHIYFRTDQGTVYALREFKGERQTPRVVEAGIETTETGGPPSKNKTFRVSLTEASGVAGYQANLSFDPTVLDVINVSGGEFGTPEYEINNSQGYIKLAQSTSSEIDVRSPTMAEITVNATGTVGDKSPLQFERSETMVSSVDGVETTPLMRAGTFTVYPRGDIDHDGETAIGDAVLVKREIANLPTNSTFDQVAADFNADGTIDVRDAVLIQQKIVGADSSTTESVTPTVLADQSAATSQSDSADVQLEQINRTDTTVTVSLRAANVSDMAGYQVNLSFNATSVSSISIEGADFGTPTINKNTAAGWMMLTEAKATGQADPVLANITFEYNESTETARIGFNHNETLLSDSDGERIASELHEARVDLSPVVPTVADFWNRPTDPDNDGVYEDINGNGEANVVDVQAMFVNRDGDALGGHPEFFDFSGNGKVDVVDVQALFAELSE